MSDLNKLTISQSRQLLDQGEISALDLVNDCLTEIDNRKSLNAFLEVFSDQVITEAKESDKRRLEGSPKGILDGIPLAIKDNILIKGRTVSSASLMLKNYQATYDATVISKLKNQGALFLGRTNMDEFAMGGSTENSAFGQTKNPHNENKVPGGSSGGSASAVGGDLSLAALGSDTGGSIRQPASFCGVVGLKPTYGTVSRYGLMAMASSLDQIGPITKTVEDAELLYQVISGRDDFDSTSVDPKTLKVNDKMVIGVPTDFVNQGLDQEVDSNFKNTINQLKDLGHEIREIKLPNLKYSLACYYVIMPAEVSTNLARFDGLRYGNLIEGDNLLNEYLNTRGQNFGPEVRRRIILGTYVLSSGYYDAYYGKAVGVRKLIKKDYQTAFDQVDIIITPTAPTPAFNLGEKTTDPLQMYLEDIFTVPVNIAGLPAISVPTGKTKDGLPLGIQLTADYFGENRLFTLGKQLEDLDGKSR